MHIHFTYDEPALISLRAVDATLVVSIPQSRRSKSDLMETYATGLRLPAWFGRNWDALFDVLCDFSGGPVRSIKVVHSGVPELAGTDEQRTYLSLLAEAVASWNDGGQLTVYFPTACQPRIEELLQRSEQ